MITKRDFISYDSYSCEKYEVYPGKSSVQRFQKVEKLFSK